MKPKLYGFPAVAPIRLGMHCRGQHDFNFIRASRAPLSLVEIKPEKFQGKQKLFFFQNGEFRPHVENLGTLVAQTREMALDVQFHFPIQELEGIGLNPGLRDDHLAIVSLFLAIAEANEQFNFLPNVTIHPPTLMWRDKRFIHPLDAGRALENNRRLLEKLGNTAGGRKKWPIRIGIENQADPTIDSHGLGYLPLHIRGLLVGTPNWVQATVDSGHRNLSGRLSVTQIVEMLADMGKWIINFHFHENEGQVTHTADDDLHRLPLGEHIHGYLNYLNRAVQEGIPIILEVNTRDYNPVQFMVVSCGIRYLMEKIKEENLAAIKAGKSYT